MPESQFKATVEMEATYECISKFSKQLKRLAFGNCKEAILEEC